MDLQVSPRPVPVLHVLLGVADLPPQRTPQEPVDGLLLEQEDELLIRLRHSDLNIFPMKPSWENSRIIQRSEGSFMAQFFPKLGVAALLLSSYT